MVFDRMTRCCSWKTGATAVSTFHIVIGIIMTGDVIYASIQYFHARVKHASGDEQHLVYSFGTYSSIQLLFGIYMLIGVLKEKHTYVLSGIALDVMGFLMGVTSSALYIGMSIHHGEFNILNGYFLNGTIFLGIEAVFIVIVFKYYRKLIELTPPSQRSLAEQTSCIGEPDGVEVECF